MPITNILPPRPADTEICPHAVSAVRWIVEHFYRLRKQYDDTMADHVLMLEAAREKTQMPYQADRVADATLINWLLEVERFWRKPVHVQELEDKVTRLESELAARKGFIGTLRSYVESTKFAQDRYVNVEDITHRMREHGVYGDT